MQQAPQENTEAPRLEMYLFESDYRAVREPNVKALGDAFEKSRETLLAELGRESENAAQTEGDPARKEVLQDVSQFCRKEMKRGRDEEDEKIAAGEEEQPLQKSSRPSLSQAPLQSPTSPLFCTPPMGASTRQLMDSRSTEARLLSGVWCCQRASSNPKCSIESKALCTSP